jgi:hypothetical protein
MGMIFLSRCGHLPGAEYHHDREIRDLETATIATNDLTGHLFQHASHQRCAVGQASRRSRRAGFVASSVWRSWRNDSLGFFAPTAPAE